MQLGFGWYTEYYMAVLELTSPCQKPSLASKSFYCQPFTVLKVVLLQAVFETLSSLIYSKYLCGWVCPPEVHVLEVKPPSPYDNGNQKWDLWEAIGISWGHGTPVKYSCFYKKKESDPSWDTILSYHVMPWPVLWFCQKSFTHCWCWALKFTASSM